MNGGLKHLKITAFYSMGKEQLQPMPELKEEANKWRQTDQISASAWLRLACCARR